MTILPLVDLLILLGSGSLAVGFVLKAVSMSTRYNPTFLAFSSVDMLLISGVCFGFALVLTARTWLKLNEPHLMALQRRIGVEEARRRAAEFEERNGNSYSELAEAPPPEVATEP